MSLLGLWQGRPVVGGMESGFGYGLGCVSFGWLVLVSGFVFVA